MEIELVGAKPYDGRYPFFVFDELTTTELGWVKRFSGYLPLTVNEGFIGGDSELFCALTVVALHRAGRITEDDVPDVYKQLADMPFATTFRLHVDDEPVEDDVGPPALSSNGNESTSGTGSPTSSERSAPTPPGSGTPASATSPSAPTTSAG